MVVRMLRGQLLMVMPVRRVRRVALVPATVVMLRRRRHAVLVMTLEVLLIPILQPQLQLKDRMADMVVRKSTSLDQIRDMAKIGIKIMQAINQDLSKPDIKPTKAINPTHIKVNIMDMEVFKLRVKAAK